MPNVIIRSDERREKERQTLRDYGVNPDRASKEQRDMADCISCKTDEVYREMRRR